MKVYGPYTRKDGRRHVILYDNGLRKTQSYPRYLMELHLGRVLEEWEQVDHINNDPTDDRIENLQILTQKENLRKSVRPLEMFEFVCPVCNTRAEIPMYRYRHNQINQGKKGPYCSKSCAGKAPLAQRQ